MSDAIRVVLIDDHALLRQGVAVTLESDPEIKVIGQGANADDAVRLALELLPDIMLLDISMPGSGINAAGAISSACPVVKIAMLTVSEYDEDVLSSLRNGAQGYILKGIPGPQLIEIVRGLHDGDSYVSPGLAGRLLSELKVGARVGKPAINDSSKLTAREEQILEHIARGLSNKEIGLELGIAEKTVKHYVTNVLQKLQVRNRVEAALLARDR
jgi:two-component system, NarL family, nitrate/nitrite response regulator NarL